VNNGIYLKEVSKKIKAARLAKGLYLRDLGKMCNIHYGAICEIEKVKETVIY
jgi:transcriptional regulator with XRE-family HTH domain